MKNNVPEPPTAANRHPSIPEPTPAQLAFVAEAEAIRRAVFKLEQRARRSFRADGPYLSYITFLGYTLGHAGRLLDRAVREGLELHRDTDENSGWDRLRLLPRPAKVVSYEEFQARRARKAQAAGQTGHHPA